jgi:hypothetical protein
MSLHHQVELREVVRRAKGAHSTQFMHRYGEGGRLYHPIGFFLMASDGQTSAQAGSSQCMQTTGTVCGDAARSVYSRWIMDTPRCVSHSAQAW